MKLPDFVQKNDITAGLAKSLEEDLVRSAKQNICTTIVPEDITQCMRRIYYRISCAETEDTKRYLSDAHKTHIVNKWATAFSKCPQTILVDKDILVAHSEYNLGGRAGAYIEFNNRKYVTHICPIAEEEFTSRILFDSLRRRDVIATMVYVWLSELQEAEGLLIYENNDTQEHVIYHVAQYDPIMRTVRSKCKELINHKMRGIPPPRIKGDNSHKECDICEYKSICLKKEDK